MKLLQEISEDIQVISEAKDDSGNKSLHIEGVFLQCIPNRNGRIYPESVMHNEVNRYIKEYVNTNRAVGELDHPPTPKMNLDRVSHKIQSLRIEGKNIYGKAKILDTNMGHVAKGLIDGGVQLGVSSRGLGTLKENDEGLKEVQEDFRLITAADIVSDPSAPSAFVTGIMESVPEWIFDATEGEWKKAAAADHARKVMKKLNKRELEESKLRLFENFLRSI